MENQNMGNMKGGRSIGPVIGLIVIIAVILLGGIYFWSVRGGGSNYVSEQGQNNGNDNTAATINTYVPNSYNSGEIEKSLNANDPGQINTN